MRSVVSGALAVSLLFAGCLLGDGAGNEPFAAKEHAWDLERLEGFPDTRGGAPFSAQAYELLAAIAVETSSLQNVTAPGVADDDLLRVLTERADPDLGDGFAPAWAYLHYSEADDRWLRDRVGTHDRGKKIDSWWADQDEWMLPPVFDAVHDGQPVGTDWMDSDEAAKRVEQINPDWSGQDAQGSVVMLLHRPVHLDHAVWSFVHWPGGGGGPGTVFLDASSGSELSFDDVFPSPEVQSGSEELVLTPLGNVELEEIQIPVDEGYAGLTIRIEPAQAPNPGMHVHAWLEDPDGNEIGVDDSAWPDPIVIEVADPMAGEWTLRLGAFSEMDLANLAELVEVQWCTDGTQRDPLHVAPAPHACLE